MIQKIYPVHHGNQHHRPHAIVIAGPFQDPVRGLDIDVDLDHRADLYRVQGGGRDLLGDHGRPGVRFRDADLVQDLFIDHDLDPSGGLVLDVVLILDIVHTLGLTDVDLVEHQYVVVPGHMTV